MIDLDIISLPDSVRDSIKKLAKDINIEKSSDKGANSYVFLGRNNISEQPVAIKYYYWGGDKKYHAEPRQLAEINCKYIIKILHTETIADGYAFFIMPFYSQGDLDDLLQQGILGNIKALDLTSNVLEGISHLHAKDFIHRDLKPQNILLSDSKEAVIGDFGSVKKINPGSIGVPGSRHSLIYMPPESFDGGLYSRAGDIYQIGILLYQLLGGYLPYGEQKWLNHRELIKYNKMTDWADKSIFVGSVLKKKIQKSAILNMKTLPPWVCAPLHRIINIASNSDPSKRFASAGDFISKLHSIKSQVLDWQIVDNALTLLGRRSFRLLHDKKTKLYFVEKKISTGWRRANSFNLKSLKEQVESVVRVS